MSERDTSLQILRLLLDDLKARHNLSPQEAFSLLNSPGEILIPCSIFVQDLTILEALIKHLADSHQKSIADIAKMLDRQPRSVWASHRRAQAGHAGALPLDSKAPHVPLSLFTHEHHTPTEALVLHLHDTQGMRFSAIGALLHRDPRTIWTLYTTGKKKGGRT